MAKLFINFMDFYKYSFFIKRFLIDKYILGESFSKCKTPIRNFEGLAQSQIAYDDKQVYFPNK